MAGGYYHTGDVASRDDDGYITYIGRTDDVFKSSDYKVSPFELESVLIEHPAVVEAAVVPQPDATRLAVPKAYVALAEGWAADADTAQAILEYARDHLAPVPEGAPRRVLRAAQDDLGQDPARRAAHAARRTRTGPGTPIDDGAPLRGPGGLTDEVLRRGPDRHPDPRGDHRGRTSSATAARASRTSRRWSTSPSGRRWTYGELNAEIDVIARGLMALGIDKGDRVGIWAPNCAEWTIVQYATAKIGAILVNINPAYRTHELAYVLNQSGRPDADRRDGVQDVGLRRSMVDEVRAEAPALTEVVFLGTADWAGLRDRADAVDRGPAARPGWPGLTNTDPINIQYTSGTTGFPKGATLSHRNILNNGFFVTELHQPGTGRSAVHSGAVLPLLRHGDGQPGLHHATARRW